MKKRTGLIIAMIVLAIGLSYAGYLLLTHSEAKPLTVSELRSGVALSNNQLRVEGIVAPGSINWDESVQIIRFVLTDDKDSLSVMYKGIVPDGFKPGVRLEIVGNYRTDGIFEVQSFGESRSICGLCH